MLNKELLEQQLSELPLYVYHFLSPASWNFPTASAGSASISAPCTAPAGPVPLPWVR